MGYQHRNGEMPDHVNQEGNNSDPRYGHESIQTKADATATAKPNYKEMERLKTKGDSLKSVHDNAFKSVVDKYESVGMKASPAAFLGEAITGDKNAQTAIRTETQIQANKDSLKTASKRKG